jgi:hypothetical protein
MPYLYIVEEHLTDEIARHRITALAVSASHLALGQVKRFNYLTGNAALSRVNVLLPISSLMVEPQVGLTAV